MICTTARILSLVLLIICVYRIVTIEADDCNDYLEGGGKDESEQGEDKR